MVKYVIYTSFDTYCFKGNLPSHNMNNRQNELITSLSRFLLRLSNTNYTNIASTIKCFTITNVKTLYITYFLCLLKHCT